MKERIGIHYGISFIYLVIIRNLLGQGYLYTNYLPAFQKSLIYCLVLSACLTILLEAWQMFKEVYIHRFKIQKVMAFLCLIAMILLVYLHSLYYSAIILFLLFYICRDNWRYYQMNKSL